MSEIDGKLDDIGEAAGIAIGQLRRLQTGEIGFDSLMQHVKLPAEADGLRCRLLVRAGEIGRNQTQQRFDQVAHAQNLACRACQSEIGRFQHRFVEEERACRFADRLDLFRKQFDQQGLGRAEQTDASDGQ